MVSRDWRVFDVGGARSLVGLSRPLAFQMLTDTVSREVVSDYFLGNLF